MSLILDALRKLDREKSSHRDGTVNIAAEILRPDLPRPSKKVSLYALGIFLTAVVTAAITYAVISKTTPPADIKLAAPTPQLPSHEPVLSAREEISLPPAKMYPSVKRKIPVETKKPPARKTPLEAEEPPVEVKSIPPSASEAKIGSEVISKEAPAPSEEIRKPVAEPPKKTAVTPASLRLSGIVWSEDPTKRLAVINGMVMTEGYVFEDVKVVEIHPDHVVLLLNDQPFELSLMR